MMTGGKVNEFVRWQWKKMMRDRQRKLWKNKNKCYVAFTQYPWSMCCLLPLLLCFFSYFQHTYQPCQQHTSQITKKYTHAYKHNISASIHAPNWHWQSIAHCCLSSQSFSPEAVFQSNQKKGLAGRPGPLSVALDGWNRHYENDLRVLVSLI